MRIAALIVTAAGLATAMPLQAQRARTLVWVSGGATLSDICCTINTGSRWGGTAGLFAAFRASRGTIVAAEASWVQKGGQDIRLDYVEIPVTFGASIPTGNGDLRIRAYTGLAFAFKIGCNSTSPIERFECDSAKGSEWSWPFGMMFSKVNQNGSFFGLDVRYSYSLSDAFSSLSSSHNRTWYFRALYGIPVGV
jgi:hypothetical protein